MRKTRSATNKDGVLGSGVKGKNLYSVLSDDNVSDVIGDGEVGGESTIWEGDSKRNSPTLIPHYAPSAPSALTDLTF